MKKLGFGLMRLPSFTEGARKDEIDQEQTNALIDVFLKQGFTYFDTAYIYGDGKSECAFRQAVVDRYPRDSYTITDKIPMMNVEKAGDMEASVNVMLERLGVSFFDYLWLHALSGPNWEKAKKFHSFEYLQELKKQGIARHIGFSFHGQPELLDEILTAHPETEYVQLQINYLDWEDPIIRARESYEDCEKHRKPVIVMEPVKGGVLADVPEEAAAKLAALDPDRSAASWAIRFAASLPNVCVVLSGMSKMEQVLDNTSFMGNFCPLTEREKGVLAEVAEIIRNNIAIPCTACRYCVSVCPMKIAIPDYFGVFNTHHRFGSGSISDVINYYGYVKQQNGKPDDCVECGACEERCPQHLPIRKYLKEVHQVLG